MKITILPLVMLIFSGVCYAGSIPFDCQSNRCGLLSDSAYTNLVVGTLLQVANDQNESNVFKWAKKNQYWKALPASDASFSSAIGMVSIATAPNSYGKPITVMIPQAELDAIKYQPGDFVRYTPHRGDYEKPPENTPEAIAYWGITGCVAVLCRGNDQTCINQYKPGVFRLPDGAQMRVANGALIKDGPVIDTHSMLPTHQSN